MNSIVLYSILNSTPQLAWWGIKKVTTLFLRGLHSVIVGEKPRHLPHVEQGILDKLNSGELRMYEVITPSEFATDGVITRFLIVDNHENVVSYRGAVEL